MLFSSLIFFKPKYHGHGLWYFIFFFWIRLLTQKSRKIITLELKSLDNLANRPAMFWNWKHVIYLILKLSSFWFYSEFYVLKLNSHPFFVQQYCPDLWNISAHGQKKFRYILLYRVKYHNGCPWYFGLKKNQARKNIKTWNEELSKYKYYNILHYYP